MKYNQAWVDEIKRLEALTLAEFKDNEIKSRSLAFQIERLIKKRDGLELILAEILIRREQLLRVQKPVCWAMEGEL